VGDSQGLRPDQHGAEEKREFYLIIESQGELYAVRWELVRQAGVLLQTEIDSSCSPSQVRKEGRSFPVRYLWELAEQTPPIEKPIEVASLFLEEKDSCMVLVPERILWKEEAVFQELPEWLPKAPCVSGAIALRSGVAVIVINPFECGQVTVGRTSEISG